MKVKNPCPFCDQLSVQVLTPTSQPNTSTHAKGFQAECINCGARGPCGYADKSSALFAWEYGDAPGSLPERALSHPSPNQKIEELIYSETGMTEKCTPVATLRQILLQGKTLSGEVVEAMRVNGYTTKQVRRAREELKLIITRKGFGLENRTYWELPAREMMHLRQSHWSVLMKSEP